MELNFKVHFDKKTSIFCSLMGLFGKVVYENHKVNDDNEVCTLLLSKKNCP